MTPIPRRVEDTRGPSVDRPDAWTRGHHQGRRLTRRQSFQRPLPGAWLQIGVAVREAGRRETEIELAVSGGEIPEAGRAKAALGEVVGGKRYPAALIGRVGNESAVQFVQSVAKRGQVLRRGIWSDVHVPSVITEAVRLDRGAADQDKRHTMTSEHAEQSLPVGIYATGICSLSHAWILSSPVRPSTPRASAWACWTSSTAR